MTPVKGQGELGLAISQAVDTILKASDKLGELLAPFGKRIDKLSRKPLAEMGISERVQLAQLILEVVDSVVPAKPGVSGEGGCPEAELPPVNVEVASAYERKAEEMAQAMQQRLREGEA